MDTTRLTIKDRDGKASIWIDDRNVWDLPHKYLNDDVLSAIESAWSIGVREATEKIVETIQYMDKCPSYKWVDGRKART